MKRSAFASFLTAAVLAVGALPALAQESRPSNSPGEQAGSRPSNGSGGTGTAVSRPSGGGGGGGGSSSGGGSSAGSSSSSGSSGTSTPSNGGGSSMGFSESRPRAPERRGGDYAVPRGGNDSFNGGRSSVGRAPASSTSSVAGVDASSEQRHAVPAYSRPRDGRAVIGQAVERPVSPGGGLGNPINIVYYPYYPYYDSYYGYPGRYGYGWGPWYGGYGFGLGYFYDPFGYYGYYSPYNDNYGYSAGSGSGRYSYNYGRETGQLRLKVNPKHGQVYVDGYFAGEVDNFDGNFQRLSIEAGSHKVEIRAEGFETATFDVMITPGETVTYKGELKKAIR